MVKKYSCIVKAFIYWERTRWCLIDRVWLYFNLSGCGSWFRDYLCQLIAHRLRPFSFQLPPALEIGRLEIQSMRLILVNSALNRAQRAPLCTQPLSSGAKLFFMLCLASGKAKQCPLVGQMRWFSLLYQLLRLLASNQNYHLSLSLSCNYFNFIFSALTFVCGHLICFMFAYKSFFSFLSLWFGFFVFIFIFNFQLSLFHFPPKTKNIRNAIHLKPPHTYFPFRLLHFSAFVLGIVLFLPLALQISTYVCIILYMQYIHTCYACECCHIMHIVVCVGKW